MLFQVHTPVPKDIPLDLPLPEWLLVSLLVISFLLHIVFINLMVGGSIITLWAQLKGRKNKEYNTFAHEIAKTITVNKSMAVVLGVAPLLSINTLYTVYFYSANALTGFAWIMIIPLVTIAFLLTYLHKYTWEKLQDNKNLHMGIIAAATGIFLFIPLVFLTNVNLMMFPEHWGAVRGFVSALLLPNVFPRYFEFLGSCISITGLFIVWYNGRRNYRVEKIYTQFGRYELKKIGYSVALTGLGLQILFGAIVLFTLPSKGLGFDVITLIGIAGILLVLALLWCWQSLTGPQRHINRHFRKIIASVGLFMLVYGASRQMYRHNALNKHQALVAEHTKEFQQLSAEARSSGQNKTAAVNNNEAGEFAKGEAVFKTYCASCHQKDKKLVGPPVTEMVSIYSGNPSGLKNWIKAPGKKRADYAQMPAFSHIPENDLDELVKFILSVH